MSTIKWVYSSNSDKSIEIESKILIEESKLFSIILNEAIKPTSVTVCLNYPEEFEVYLVPILTGDDRTWKDMEKIAHSNVLCRLMQMADHLQMTPLVDELHIRLCQFGTSIFCAKDFCPDNISKYHMQAMLTSYKLEFLKQLKMILLWLNDSSPEVCREMNEWLVSAFHSEWHILIPKNTNIKEWKHFCFNRKSGGYKTSIDKFFTAGEMMDIDYKLFYQYKGPNGNSFPPYRELGPCIGLSKMD